MYVGVGFVFEGVDVGVFVGVVSYVVLDNCYVEFVGFDVVYVEYVVIG